MSASIFEPIFDYQAYELEDRKLYLERTLKLLPNFPEEVIFQWFYDHPQQVHEHEWLIYERLRFELTEWRTCDVPTCDFGNTAAVDTYRHNYFSKGIKNSRRDRLESHFITTGTWPIPPIFLANKQGNLSYPHGFPCGKPYHLLEGHNRMAFFLEYKTLKQLLDTHLVYIAERT